MSQTPNNPTVPLTSGFSKPEGTTLGIGLTSPSPEFAQICGNSGFDIVLIDMEHGPISIETAYRMVTALANTEAEAWIRVTWNDPALIKQALDTGAQHIIVPMVTTREEARSGRSTSGTPICLTTPAGQTQKPGCPS